MESNFQNRLKKLRAEHDMTQEDLGKKLGYGRSTIAAYEAGRNEPAYDDLKKLSELFSVSVDYLIGTSNIKKADTPPVILDMLDLDKSKVRLLKSLEEIHLTPEQAERLLRNIVKTLQIPESDQSKKDL